MNELTDLYPALATVAAITTAIQTPIVLGTFSECSVKVTDLDPTNRGSVKYGNAERERGSVARKNIFLNFPATVVNAFAIIPWGYLVYSHRAPADEWLYFLPWLGVAVAALFLFLLVASSILALWTRWGPAAVAAIIVAAIAIWLMVAREFHAWPF